MAETYSWLRAGHFIGLFVWLGGMFAVYWLMRIHVHAPKEAHEKLTLMERSLALMMDIAAALAIGAGFAMAFVRPAEGMKNLFAQPGAGWFHIKLTLVVLAVLPVHGMLRARIKKLGMGKLDGPPQWQWSLLIVAMTLIVLLVTQGPRWFAK